jgi:hypothetical protein
MSRLSAAQQEVAEVVASADPRRIAELRPSDAARERAWELVAKSKAGTLTAEERTELDGFMQLEHTMRLAKARARLLLQQAE